MPTGSAPPVMATPRSTAINLRRLSGPSDLAWATRHHARDVNRPAEPLMTWCEPDLVGPLAGQGSVAAPLPAEARVH